MMSECDRQALLIRRPWPTRGRFDMSECDREVLLMRRPWPTRGRFAMDKIVNILHKGDYHHHHNLRTLICR